MGQCDRRRRNDGPIERLPVGDEAQVKARAQLAPQAGLAARCCEGGLKQPAAALLDLIDQEGVNAGVILYLDGRFEIVGEDRARRRS